MSLAMFTLANPLGLLALLGIPIVIAIHFLQRQARPLPISTLFLLEHTQKESLSGRQFDRLLSSLPLWMQLLCVLLLAWLLADPRVIRDGSVHQVAIVVDSSASMAVFKPTATAELSAILPTLANSANSIEITLLESNPQKSKIYSGNSIPEAIAAFSSWQPYSGRIDPSEAIRLARSIVSRDGSVIYLSDTPEPPLPFAAQQIAVGKPIENVGFSGVSYSSVDQTPVWIALITNHGTQTATRSWQLISDAGATEPKPITIPPGAMVTLQAAIPANAKHLRVTLTPDEFPLDDTLPLLRPQPKPLTLAIQAGPTIQKISEKLAHSLDHTQIHSTNPDILCLGYKAINPPTLANHHAIVMVEDESRSGSWLTGNLVAESHPLMNGLNWQALLVRNSIQLETLPSDTILLWQDKRPLILLRTTNHHSQLLFNFDPSLSNIDKQTAFPVLLHRFCESIRAEKIAPSVVALDTDQALSLPALDPTALTITTTNPSGTPTTPPPISAHRAPSTPGFLTITYQNQALLDAAVSFGDPRESNFSQCASATLDPTSLNHAAQQKNSLQDPLWRIWFLLVLAALLLSWRTPSTRSPAL